MALTDVERKLLDLDNPFVGVATTLQEDGSPSSRVESTGLE